MFRRGFFFLVFVGIVIAGALSVGARSNRARYAAAYDAGYSDGQASVARGENAAGGETAAAGDTAAVGENDGRFGYGYRGTYYGYHNFGPFSFIGGLFRVLFFFLLIGLLLRILGFGRWRHRGGHWHGGPRGKHCHHAREDSPASEASSGDVHAPREKQPEDVNPDIRMA